MRERWQTVSRNGARALSVLEARLVGGQGKEWEQAWMPHAACAYGPSEHHPQRARSFLQTPPIKQASINDNPQLHMLYLSPQAPPLPPPTHTSTCTHVVSQVCRPVWCRRRRALPRRSFEGGCVGSVRRHAQVQTGAARQEAAVLLSLVLPAYEAHKLGGGLQGLVQRRVAR